MRLAARRATMRAHKSTVESLVWLIVVLLSLLLVNVPLPSGAQLQQQQPATQLPAAAAAISGVIRPINGSINAALQAHLSAMQSQAQRQISQLNGLVLSGASQLVNSPLAAQAANFSVANKYGNVLEVLSNVGKAIQQQISNSGNQIQIITSPNGVGGSEQANSKKNEYQAVGPATNQANDGQQLLNGATQQAGLIRGGNQPQLAPTMSTLSQNNQTNYREQGEQLRQEIVRRAGQLQQVVAGSMEVLKNNGDLIVRRLLEQLNNRLDQAKSKADKIISEPASNEMGVKALNAINQGLNNLNNIITNIVSRLDMGNKEGQAAAQASGQPQRVSSGPQPNSPTANLLDPARFKLNLQQIGQQFSSALNAVQQQHRVQQQAPQQQQLSTLIANGSQKLTLPSN